MHLRRVQHDTTSESHQELPPDAVWMQSSLTRKPKLIEEIHWNTTTSSNHNQFKGNKCIKIKIMYTFKYEKYLLNNKERWTFYNKRLCGAFTAHLIYNEQRNCPWWTKFLPHQEKTMIFFYRGLHIYFMY